jgi:hypothetical protein
MTRIRTAAICLLGGGVALALLSAPAPSAVPVKPRVASLETAGFKEFDGVDSTPGVGRVTRVESRAYDGDHAARAETPRGPGNHFARAAFDVRWDAGDDVWYGGAFFLPRRFYADQQGQVAILRWDNWALEDRTQDQGGLVILADGRWALMANSVEENRQVLLTEPVEPPAPGRWHWVEVRQRLAAGGGARNELWLDGERVSASQSANWQGRPVTKLRFGIVAVHEGYQVQPLRLWFDRSTLSPRRIGPIRGRAARRCKKAGA